MSGACPSDLFPSSLPTQRRNNRLQVSAPGWLTRAAFEPVTQPKHCFPQQLRGRYDVRASTLYECLYGSDWTKQLCSDEAWQPCSCCTSMHAKSHAAALKHGLPQALCKQPARPDGRMHGSSCRLAWGQMPIGICEGLCSTIRCSCHQPFDPRPVLQTLSVSSIQTWEPQKHAKEKQAHGQACP